MICNYFPPIGCKEFLFSGSKRKGEEKERKQKLPYIQGYKERETESRRQRVRVTEREREKGGKKQEGE